MTLLHVKDLIVDFRQNGAVTNAVRNVSFTLDAGKTLGIVGESGSGKSVTAMSILQLLPTPPASYAGGDIIFNTQSTMTASDDTLRKIRGNDIAMIFQEPMTALNPLHTVGAQISEALSLHGQNAKSSKSEAIALMQRVGIKDAETRYSNYPHELSGGQRQRIIIAMAIANRPKLLIADEPTTALDVTIQKQILDLLKDLQAEYGLAILLITHDLGVVRYMADTICVMQNGEIIEHGNVDDIFKDPKHPYTKTLFDAVPKDSPPPPQIEQSPILEARHIRVQFTIKKNLFSSDETLQAVDGVNMVVYPGESLGVVGESGSGKTTLGRALLGLQKSEGDIIFRNQATNTLSNKEARALRKDRQIVFQDPFGSLSPRMSVGKIITEGLDVHEKHLSAEEKAQRLAQTLKDVELDISMVGRYPHEFSGGQRQRIAIARALIMEPELLVLDEPTSALDRSVQAQIINLLRRLQTEKNITYIFISHDLNIVRALSHRIMVMQNGKCVETGITSEVFKNPQEAYTQRLIQAVL